MIIRMVNEFKLTVVHVAQPNNPKPMQICACAWSYRWTKTVENQDWAAGLLGRGLGRFSKVPKLCGPFSGVTIPLATQEWRAFNSSNFTVICLFVTLKTC